MDEQLRAELAAVLESLWNSGCPAASPTNERTVDRGLRRWRSFERRNTIRRPGREDRIADLAKGLWEAFEPAGNRWRSELVHYRCIAEAFAEVLEPVS
jgi:hypothetical protein